MKIRKIYLSWRKGQGSPRKIVGLLKRTASDGITFKYLKEGVEAAQKEGFNAYPGFPLDFEKVYEEKDLDVFGLRLASFERKDSARLLSFWEAEGIEDKFDLLALTQGLLPTDNFEFLGLFNASTDMKFVTDVAGLSYSELEKDAVKIGDYLSYKPELNKEAYQDRAIKLFKGETEIGYIKNIHNNPFIQSNKELKLRIKAIEQNSIIKKIFVLVSY